MKINCVRFLLVVLLGLFTLPALPAHAQENHAQPLITQPIDAAKLVTLRGNTHPMAIAKYDRGLAPASLPMGHMFLVLKRSAQQEASLDTLLAQQQDRTSPSYHKWLTPAEFGAQFGPSDQDIQKITSWLQSQGFEVNKIANGRNVIDFSGNAGEVQAAFHTAIHRYVLSTGEQHWANSTDPRIPAALASAVVGVSKLNDFRPRPMVHNMGTFKRSMTTGKTVAVKSQITFPNLDCYSGNNNCYAVGPYDFAKIYNVMPLWNAGTTGAGQTIAIVSDSDVYDADYQQFRSLFGLPALTGSTFQRVLPTGHNPGVQACAADGDEQEAIVDVEWAGAVAPGATIDLVISPSAGDCNGDSGEGGLGFGGDYSAQYIVDNNLAPILSDSYGACELSLGATENAFYNTEWQQAAGEGITVVVAAGDSGASGCDSYEPDGQQDDVAPAQFGLEVNGAASTPYNIAVGGTDFDYSNFNNPSKYWSSTNSNSGTAQTLSVLGYIPEMVWNDTCTNFAVYQGLLSGLSNDGKAETACNDANNQDDNLVGPVGGSGGKSNCITTNPVSTIPADCAGGYPKPAWQTGQGVPSDGARDLPDVSLFAADAEISGTAYAECEDDLEASEELPAGQACSLTVVPNGGSPYVEIEEVGGTSVAAQAFAGVMALEVQKNGRQGLFNPSLYALAGGASASSCASSSPASTCVFYDVTAGTNAMPCLAGSTNCTVTNNSDQVGVLTGYAAGTGYDQATGLGTVNVANLVAGSGAGLFYLSSADPVVTIASGSTTGTLALSAASVNGFSGTISTFTCSGLPSGANCTAVAATPITLTASGAGSTGSTTLTITLASAAASTPFSHLLDRNWWTGSKTLAIAFILSIAIALLAFYGRPRRRITVFAALAFAMLVVTTGCGGGGGGGGGGG
ncbi:MAG: S53 family peptidase, partial [Candidatus Acidiferrales bacterium]